MFCGTLTISKTRRVFTMKRRNLMYKLSTGALSMMAVMALTVTSGIANASCAWFFGQDEMPKNVKKLRKF